jgi:hypothetical protein
VDRHLWLAVADAPLDRFDEATINARLADLDWVSRAAIAHEAVVESFIASRAVLPMKLFTIFTSDGRAAAHVLRDRRRVAALVKRVENKAEWGVRVMLVRDAGARVGPAAARSRPGAATPATSRSAGATYLAQKKAQRDSAAELAERAKAKVAGLYRQLSACSSLARRRVSGELAAAGGPLLLDAAFLVSRPRPARFRALVSREARRLAHEGYRVTLTGPWPPYTFVRE